MTAIQTSCTRCGDVNIHKSDVELRINADNPGSSLFGFSCPLCHETVVRRAGARVVRLLVSSGVKARAIVTDAPPIAVNRVANDYDTFTFDDIISFHQKLQSDDWMSELLGNQSA